MLLAIIAAGALLAASHAQAATWDTIVVGAQSEPERLATVDLQRYLAQVTGVVPKTISADRWRAAPVPALIIGAAAANPTLKAIGASKVDLGQEGYVLANATLSRQPVVIAAGQTGAGTVNAIYGLLRELGYGFFLGSEAVPEMLPPRLPSDAAIVRRPAFGIRGVLPWYNFFDSPTAWDPIDHRAVIDQLIRSGANFIGFHTYDHEPFAAYEEAGKMQWGGRLLNTRSPTWGTHSMATGEFAFGTDKLFADDYFGAATTQSHDDPSAVIRREQDVVRDAFDYARRRGVHTCIGFEVTGDPTNPATRKIVVKRLKRLLDEYPAADYLWIWQSEAQAGPGYREDNLLRETFKPGSALEPYAAARRTTFRRIVDSKLNRGDYLRMDPASRAARALEGARLEQFARLACRVIHQRQDPPRLVVSGWGGDEYLCSEEYYEGLDKLLPRDVVFASLDMIRPHPRVDAIYGEFAPDRQRWPIPWLECDGDQWHPQPNVHTFEGVAADAHRKGGQGILGIHWRTRDIEENLAYLVDYAWQPGLTAEEFFEQLAARCYSAAIAGDMARIHSRLDSMGWRWVGGAGQSECGSFQFGPGTPEKIKQLQVLRRQVAALLPKAGRSAPRVRWLLARIDWTLAYSHAEIAAVKAQQLLDSGNAADALATLDTGDLANALRVFASRLTTRGEYGVLATINTKAVYAWRELRGRCLATLGREPEDLPAPKWTPQPEIVLPRLIASVPQGEDLELMPIVLGGKPAWMHYRTLGQPAWKTLELNPVKGWVCRAVLPGGELVSPGVEIAFSFDRLPAASPAWGPQAVTVMPPTAVDEAPRPFVPLAAQPRLTIGCTSSSQFPFMLRWNEVAEAEYYKVYRDEVLAAETCVAFYPDGPTRPAARHQYRVEACRDGRVLAQAALSAASPDSTAPIVLKPRVRWGKTRATILWPPPDTWQISGYTIERAGPNSAGKFAFVADVPAVHMGTHQIAAKLDPGQTTYRITPVNQVGRRLSGLEVSLRWPNDKLREVVVADVIARAKPQGKLEVAGGAVHFTGRGHLELAHDDLFNLSGGGTVSFEFQADRLDDMPVLLSHGQWQVDGWFFQILGGQLMIRTTGGDVLGPQVQRGKWYSLRWEFDGLKADLFIDGKLYTSVEELPMSACRRMLRVGQYDQPGPSYAFHGSIRNLRIRGWVPRSGS